MADKYQGLTALSFQGGIDVSSPVLSDVSQNALGDGTWNTIIGQYNKVKPWSGVTSQGANTGSRKMMNYSNTWGGIKDISIVNQTFVDGNVSINPTNSINTVAHGYPTGISALLTTTGTLPTGLSIGTTYYIIRIDADNFAFATSLLNALLGTRIVISAASGGGTHTVNVNASTVLGSGSFFQSIGKSRWGIGAGQPCIEGINVTGFVLSTLLQVSVATGGVYGAPVQAGLSQPSAPEIGIINVPGDISNSMSAKLERRRPSTGARSVASPTSAVIQPQGNRIRVTFPLSSTGQTHWRVYFPFQGFGGTGIHYLGTYGGNQDIPESVVAAGVVDGIARSLEFNFKDGDLIPIEASYDDYAPPAATFALPLDVVLTLPGCYADSVTSPTTGSPGVSIAVSKINNFESYIPTWYLTLPESPTDVLSRPIDDYGWIACESSIHMVQFVGDRGEELPPVVITTPFPNVGVQYAHNWCQFLGMMLIYSAEGQLLLVDERGSLDADFAAPIAAKIATWNPADTVVGFDAKNNCAFIGNGTEFWEGSLQSRAWRRVWLPDYVAGSFRSCVTAKRRMFASIANGSALTAYSMDTGTATTGLSFCVNYQNSGIGVKDIYEMTLSALTDVSTDLAICINKNLGKTVFRQIGVTTGSNSIGDTEGNFTEDMEGQQFIVFGTNIGGAGTSYIRGRFSVFGSANSFLCIDLVGNALSPFTTAGDLMMFTGHFIGTSELSKSRQFPNFFPNMVELRSYQVAVWFKGQTEGNTLNCGLIGAEYPSTRATDVKRARFVIDGIDDVIDGADIVIDSLD